MRFRDFLLKTLLSDTDYLVGYDASGNYIRIRKSDLANQFSPSSVAQTINVQYSSNGESWHDTYESGDAFLRIKAGSSHWSPSIRISISAYDIWKEAGNSGSVEDFLDSLKSEEGGEVDFSGLQLQNIDGYQELLQDVDVALANAQASIVSEIVEEAVGTVMAQYKEMQLEDIGEVKSLNESDYITIVTADGLRKVSLGTLSDNVAIRTVSTTTLEKSVIANLKVLTVRGVQDGENRDYSVLGDYIFGTSMLFLNGQRLTPGLDYKETNGGFTMISYVPEELDQLLFEAVVR
jgi:hypothetical protein